ncbi:class I SAM-dependent methyltransferase [Caballeronia sp. NCTM5]|uniref:class I SAM-dependent methyltransferase n=1 Tax=Caballeronia sp. NCTM5 TaxID=2921755 RepID=UPI0020285C12|nr:class I SAM-dependent methyltransferase [Caballeronia sp. NCTM5]
MKAAIQKAMTSIGYTILKSATLESLRAEVEKLRGRISELENIPRPKLQFPDEYPTSPQFNTAGLSGAAMEKLITEFQFQSVLDVGAGAQLHSEIFARHGKTVTAVDFGTSEYHRQKNLKDELPITEIVGDFLTIDFPHRYDCVWASHVLEHQPNVSQFLAKAVSILEDGGILAITVPPFKHEIVGGHVSVWNAGLLLYRLVLAGIDCSDASVLSYGYNISVIVKKRMIENFRELELEFDCGDIRKLKPYLPRDLRFNSNALDDPFDGDVKKINW